MNDGGPAFGRVKSDPMQNACYPKVFTEGGMSKFEVFAAAAMTGIIAASGNDGFPSEEYLTNHSLRFAAAMIKAIESREAAKGAE